jgi:hypothetical protein
VIKALSSVVNVSYTIFTIEACFHVSFAHCVFDFAQDASISRWTGTVTVIWKPIIRLFGIRAFRNIRSLPVFTFTSIRAV